MQIFDDTKKRVGTLSGFRNREITRTLDSGDKELVFEYPAHGEMVDLLKEEYYIRTKTDEFVLRAVEKAADWNKYTAQLNVEELEGQSFPYGFASQEQTISACLEFAFEGTGWTVGTCTVTKKRTIDIKESTTAWRVLQDSLSTYRCECNIDTLNKTVNIYETIGQDRGCYFMEGLNLRKLSINSDTYEFYTRIIPIGKDGITIEGVCGKEYLENYQYSKKIKTYTWKDERYTNTTSLMEDAEAKLDEMSRPYKAYNADVVDLAKANPEYSAVLDYGIGDTVTLVSKRTGTRENQRIVKITEFPETPEKNTVELSNVTRTFAEVQKSETELAKQEAISIANSTTKKTLTENYYDKKEVESHITASHEEIELKVSEKYETKEIVTEKYNSAVKAGQDAADAAERAANAATDEKLTEYSTTQEMQAAIEMTAKSINLSVSETYETKEIVTEKYNSAVKAGQDAADAAERAANAATDEKLTEYSTTQEMQAEIKLTSDKIDLKVSKGDVSGQISVETGEVNISGNRMQIQSDNFKLNKTGVVEAQGKFTAKQIQGSDTFESVLGDAGVRVLKNGSEVGRLTSGSVQNDQNMSGIGLMATNVITMSNGSTIGYIFNPMGAISGHTERNLMQGGLRCSGDLSVEKVKFRNEAYMGYTSYDNVESLTSSGGFYAYGSIGCQGTKYRVVNTEHYGKVGLNALETPSAYFADIGSGTIGQDGKCYILIDSEFMETISRDHEIYVQITTIGDGDAKVDEKNIDGIIVSGKEGTKFDWIMFAKQKNYETDRLERVRTDNPGIDYDDSIFSGDGVSASISENYMYDFEKNYEDLAENYLSNYEKELNGND